ncbi:hypothetical protein AB0C21_08250 [Spirillospora sp. NPDC049024]
MADIAPIGRGHEPPAWRPTRLNVRYQPAVRLAELVLRGASVEHRPGNTTVGGFLLDMARVFEEFVTVSLREALSTTSGHCVLQATHHLDENHAIRMVPDFVHYTDDGIPQAVADAKYKAERPEGFPDADLYQMLAYCTALRLSDGHLIYAKGNTRTPPTASGTPASPSTNTPSTWTNRQPPCSPTSAPSPGASCHAPPGRRKAHTPSSPGTGDQKRAAI